MRGLDCIDHQFDHLNLTKSNSNLIKTADSSPINTTFSTANMSNLTKKSSKITKIIISSTNLELKLNKSIEKNPNIIKFYYLLPKSLFSDNETVELKAFGIIEKYDFLIFSHNYEYTCNQTLNDILIEIKLMLNKTIKKFNFKLNSKKVTLRSSKKSGFPDFDLPIINNDVKLIDLLTINITLCYGSTEEDLETDIVKDYFEDIKTIHKSEKIVRQEKNCCSCTIF